MFSPSTKELVIAYQHGANLTTKWNLGRTVKVRSRASKLLSIAGLPGLPLSVLEPDALLTTCAARSADPVVNATLRGKVVAK